MAKLWRDLGKRCQNKGTLVRSRVRQNKLRALETSVTEENQIEIDLTWTPPNGFARAFAPQRRFDRSAAVLGKFGQGPALARARHIP